MSAWNETVHTRIQTHLFKLSPALFLQQERILEHFSEASLKPLLEDLLYHAKDGAHQQVGHNGFHDGDYPLAPFPSPARSCASIPLVTSWCKSLWSPGLKSMRFFLGFWELRGFSVRSFSLGPVHCHCDLKKGCLTKNGNLGREASANRLISGIWKLVKFPVVLPKPGLLRCELNVDQEHAPATYRKALIEIIAQYLGAVVRCGNSMKLRQETPFRVMKRQQKNKRSGKYCEKCRIPPLLEMLYIDSLGMWYV